jgi:hypothetical protein
MNMEYIVIFLIIVLVIFLIYRDSKFEKFGNENKGEIKEENKGENKEENKEIKEIVEKSKKIDELYKKLDTINEEFLNQYLILLNAYKLIYYQKVNYWYLTYFSETSSIEEKNKELNLSNEEVKKANAIIDEIKKIILNKYKEQVMGLKYNINTELVNLKISVSLVTSASKYIEIFDNLDKHYKSYRTNVEWQINKFREYTELKNEYFIKDMSENFSTNISQIKKNLDKFKNNITPKIYTENMEKDIDQNKDVKDYYNDYEKYKKLKEIAKNNIQTEFEKIK